MADGSFDVAVIGGSFGGCACALAAARTGRRVVLVEQSATVGGQATSQGVTRWDEVEAQYGAVPYGSTKSYEDLKRGVRSWYGDRHLLARGIDVATFNPGWYGSPYPFSADPAVVQEVLTDQLRAAGVEIVLRRKATGVALNGATIASVTFDDASVVHANLFVDATDLGDLLPLCPLKWNVGEEAQNDTGEHDAPSVANARHVQPITVPIAVERREGGSLVAPTDLPADIIAAQDFRWEDGDIGGVFTPRSDPKFSETIFGYRQYIDHRNFASPEYAGDRSTINVGSNDYKSGIIPTGDASADGITFDNARKVSLEYLRWLQTSVERDDDTGFGYPDLCVRTDAFPESGDGLAPQPYIRESRRIARPVIRIVERDISQPDRSVLRAPKNFTDSGGIGWYPIADIHESPLTPARHVDNVRNFQIPLGALIPTEITNLLAGCKNIGTTHLTTAAYRMHPIEWAVGEAAGTLAAYCVGQRVTAAAALKDPTRVTALQTRLLQNGAPIFWWSDVTVKDRALFFAAQMLGVLGYFIDPKTLTFRPNDPMTPRDRTSVERRLGRKLTWPATLKKRGETAVWVYSKLTDEDRRRAREQHASP